MVSLFISYASPDRAFALQLARNLQQLGYFAWIDVQDIQVGESIPHGVAAAVERADYLIVVLSRHTAASSWSEHEWYAKYWDEVVRRQPLVLPVLLEDCSIPFFLRPKRYADFRLGHAVGLAQLAMALHEYTKLAGPRIPMNWPKSGAAIEASVTYPSTVALIAPVCYTNDTMKPPVQLTEVNVALDLPYIGSIAGVWKPDAREQDAAWELYVELVTRIAVVELRPGDGLLRESLSSLYSIFTTTRHILRKYGPSVARPHTDSELSFGYLSISLLNYGLRPVLTKWHPLLLDYEHERSDTVSPLQHEMAWEHAEEVRQVLNDVRCILLEYTKLLAHISRVPAPVP